MKPLKVFRWRDALTFGLVAVAFTVLAILTPHLGHSEKISDMAAQYSSWAAAIVAWIFYGAVLLMRFRTTLLVSFMTRHKIYVAAGQFPQIIQADFEAETERFLDLWERQTGTDARRYLPGLLVVFKELPFEHHGRPGKLAGLFYPGSKTAFVGTDGIMPLSSTALDHEFGHCIYGQVTGDWRNDSYHQFAYQKDLP